MLRRGFRLKASSALGARLRRRASGSTSSRSTASASATSVFTPGWTSYRKRLQYQTYDVTAHLRAGENAIGATLGDGWYRGYLAWRDKRNVYGHRLGLLLPARIEYPDGSVEIVGSDAAWKAATGPIRASDIYMGETYDARLERPGWSAPGFDDREWTPVRVVDRAAGR